MPNKPNKKPPLLAQEAAMVQHISTSYSTTQDRDNTIKQLYSLVKDDPQARRFLAELLAELDQKEASA